MDTVALFSHFAVALGIGLLIGLERGWTKRAERAGGRAAGIRTFSITGLLGGLAGATAQILGGAANAAGGLVLGLAFVGYAVAITLFCIEENRADKTFSATTAIAGMLTFALGAFALIGSPTIAGAIAVTAAGLLALRRPMHGWLRKINENE
ncbi:MAG: MgtC/SapB family protein, partial [Pseudorhodoplanes sp.]